MKGTDIMKDFRLTFTYIGGPTAILELGGFRLLTDPTFDPAGSEYPTGLYTLRKIQGPALSLDSLGHIDAILLSHDHHFDNLDHSGRTVIEKVEQVVTTPAGAERLGGKATGLRHWECIDLHTPDGLTLKVTGTPTRHGPPGGDRGPVTGFLLTLMEYPHYSVYVSGDTVWYGDIEAISRRYPVSVAILFMGAARVLEVGPAHLTFNAEEGVQAARAFQGATIVPLHYEGWDHFSESRQHIENAFGGAGMSHRLQWMEPGRPTDVILQ